MENKKKTVWGIVGPTASGKTALSFPLAKHLHSAILCMDSMQVYQGMDIGTAKPTKQEQKEIPHYLLDLVAPSENFTVTEYSDCAVPLLNQLENPILVGGTGLYLQALSTDSTFGTVEGDENLRARLHQTAEEKGLLFLHDQLKSCDPVSAQKIHPNDIRRVVRALEVYQLTGVPFSQQKRSSENCPYDFHLYAVDMPRDVLYSRINQRVDAMMKEGLLGEVETLRDQGIPEVSSAMQGLGYKELFDYLAGRVSLEEAVSLIKLRTRHFAKRQLTWFRRDERIHWLPWSPDSQEMSQRLLQALPLAYQ